MSNLDRNSPIFLENEELHLRPLTELDALGPYPSWLNDAIVCAGNSHGRFPYTANEANKFIADNQGRRDQIVLAVVEKASGLHIGNAALQSIDWVNRGAEIAILLGDKDAWGKGYAKSVCRLLIEHAFKVLGLQRVHCGTFETNSAMQGVALGLGMKEEGCRRKAVYKNGEFINLLEYGLLHEEYDFGGGG